MCIKKTEVLTSELSSKLLVRKYSVGEFSVDTINVRNLYEALKIEEDFLVWIDRKLSKYSVAINYFFVPGDSGAQQLLTFNTAREIAISERSERGKAVARYLNHRYVDTKKVSEMLLSDSEKYSMITHFSKEIKCEVCAAVMPSDALSSVVSVFKETQTSLTTMQNSLKDIGITELESSLISHQTI